MKQQVTIPVLGIYCRVSTDKQAVKGLSLRDQELRGIEKANSLGWKYEIFKDAALSGSISYKERPALNKLVEGILSGDIEGLWCVDIDRLSREVNDGTILLSFLIENKARLFDVKGEIDIQDEGQEALQRIRLIFSDLERRKIKARVKRSLERNALDGKVGGGPLIPFGYTKDENKKMIVEKEEAKIVKQIFKLALNGQGTKVISNILNEAGTLTKRGRIEKGYMQVRGNRQTIFEWRDAVIYHILTNPLYFGERRYKGKTVPAPAIIDESTFYAVQDVLKTRNNFKNTTNKYNYLLKGLLFCSVCGRPFHGHKRADNSDNAYKCNSARYKGQFCGNTGISIDYIEELVWSQLLNLDKSVTEYYKWLGIRNLKSLRKKRQLHKEIEGFKLKNENLIKAIENGSAVDTLTQRLDTNNITLSELQIEFKALIESESVLLRENDIVSLIKQHTAGKAVSFDKKLEVVRALINRINIDNTGEKTKVQLEYKIDGLTGVKLGKNIELTNKLLGNSVRDRKVKNTSLIINQEGAEIVELSLK